MALPSVCVINRAYLSVMFKGCSSFPAFINQNVKLFTIPQTTSIRNYTMTYDEEEREKKIKKRAIKINVIMPDQKVVSMTLDQALKMAKRRDFVMDKLVDPPKFASYAGREVYEMVTKSQHVKLAAEPAEVACKSEFKDKKTITMSATITPHDMTVKLNQVKKWLAKKHLAVIVFEGEESDARKEKIKSVSEELKDVCNCTTVSKKKQIVLTLVPTSNTPKGNEKTGSTDEEKQHEEANKELVP